MSGNDKKSIPEVPKPLAVPGNLLSSVAPPSQLPNFITTLPAASSPEPQNVPQPAPQPVQPVLVKNKDLSPQSPEKFSPAIPPSKGEPTLPIRSPEDSQRTQSLESLPENSSNVDNLESRITAAFNNTN